MVTGGLSCIYTCEHVWKICFSTNFWWTSGNWRTNCAGSYVKIVGKIGKSSRERGREQKLRWTRYSLSHEHPSCSSKKPTGDGLQQTVRELCTNYTNIVFANWFANEMLANEYAALEWLWSAFPLPIPKTSLHILNSSTPTFTPTYHVPVPGIFGYLCLSPRHTQRTARLRVCGGLPLLSLGIRILLKRSCLPAVTGSGVTVGMVSMIGFVCLIERNRSRLWLLLYCWHSRNFCLNCDFYQNFKNMMPTSQMQ